MRRGRGRIQQERAPRPCGHWDYVSIRPSCPCVCPRLPVHLLRRRRCPACPALRWPCAASPLWLPLPAPRLERWRALPHRLRHAPYGLTLPIPAKTSREVQNFTRGASGEAAPPRICQHGEERLISLPVDEFLPVREQHHFAHPAPNSDQQKFRISSKCPGPTRQPGAAASAASDSHAPGDPDVHLHPHPHPPAHTHPAISLWGAL